MGSPFQPSDQVVRLASTTLVRVVDTQNRLQGGALVVRVTEDRVALAMFAPPPNLRQLSLLWGDHTIRANVQRLGSNLALLKAPRGGLELRAVHPAPNAAPGEFVFVYNALPNRGFVRGLASIAKSSADRLLLLEPPSYGSDDSRDSDEILEALPGGMVFGANGGFLGFVSGAEDDQPVVLRLNALRQPLLEAIAKIGGAERMGPADGFLTYLLQIGQKLSPEQLPRVDDAWGDPDYFLLLEGSERRIARTELTPGRSEPEPLLVWTSSRRGLTARLVERDLNLTEGEVEEDLASPLTVEARDPMVCSFDVLPSLGNDYPQVREGPQRTRVVVRMREVDPERASGPDRTPLGARPLGLARVATGAVDWQGGDATDFWSIDVGQGGAMLCFLFRERPDAQLRLEAYSPGQDAPVLASEPSSGRLVAARGTSAPGRLLVRVRQVGGPAGRAGYGLFLFPASEPPDALARALMRMIGRQSANARSYMGSREFAREVQTALTGEAGFSSRQLAQAFLGALGQRTSAARHLALHLLQAHFRPTLAELETVRRRGASERAGVRRADLRSKDAALLLAQRCGDHRVYMSVLAEAAGVEPEVLDTSSPLHDGVLRARLEAEARRILRRAVLDAAVDASDHRIRLRALAAASAWREPRLKDQLRLELRQILGQDPSPIVRRALERAFPPEADQRERRLRARSRGR